MSREIDVSGVLAPLGKFGDWISSLLPKFKVSIQDYIKIPVSGLPEYIIALEAETSFDCGILNKIWDFCAQKQSASLKMSVGFTGFDPDPPNTYDKIGAGSLTKKLSMAQLPVCPAPVKHVCAFDLTLVFLCSNNDISHVLSAFRVVLVR